MPQQFFLNPAKRKQYVLVLGDAVIVLIAFVVGQVLYSLLKQAPVGDMIGRLRLPWLLSVAAIHLICFYVFNLYDLRAPQRSGRRVVAIALAVAVSIGLSAALLFFLSTGPTVNRFALLLHMPVVVAGVSVWRNRFFHAIQRRGVRRRIAFLGGDPIIPSLAREIGSSSVWDSEVVGTLVEGAVRPGTTAERVVRCSPRELPSFVSAERIETVVVSVTARPSSDLLDAAHVLRFNGVEVVDLPSFAARISGRIPVHSITSEWVLQALSVGPGLDLVRNGRRVAEFFAAAVIAILAAPLLLLIPLAIRLESSGPVLFRQQRLGRNEHPFPLYKFRTMVVDAEASTGPRWADTGDPRITRVGRILRQTGLDELPQLFNILRGDMSFVGPRPIRRHFADLLAAEIPYYRLRFTVRPGVTGWAQIRHDYAGSVHGQQEKFEYELFSLRNTSPLMDLYILLKTVQKLVMRRVGEVSTEAPAPPEVPAAEPRPATGDDSARALALDIRETAAR